MTYIKLDDTCPDHPSLVGLTDAGFACWIRGLCYSSRHLTDGLIPRAALRSLGTPKAAAELVAAGRWIPVDGGWKVHGYEEKQRTRDQVEAERDAGRKRQQRHRATPESRRDTAVGHTEVTEPEVEVRGEVEVEDQPIPSPVPGEETTTPHLELVVADTPPPSGLLFDAWWGMYPKKVGKQEARTEFAKAIRRATVEDITRGLVAAIAAWDAEGRERHMIPDPARWLRRDRWSDDHAPGQRRPQQGTQAEGVMARTRARIAEAESRSAHPAARAITTGGPTP